MHAPYLIGGHPMGCWEGGHITSSSLPVFGFKCDNTFKDQSAHHPSISIIVVLKEIISKLTMLRERRVAINVKIQNSLS